MPASTRRNDPRRCCSHFYQESGGRDGEFGSIYIKCGSYWQSWPHQLIEEKAEQEHKDLAPQRCNLATCKGQLGNTQKSRHLAVSKKPPAAAFQGSRFGWGRRCSSCFYVLVLIHVLSIAGLAAALPFKDEHQQQKQQLQQRTPTPTLKDNKTATYAVTVTDGVTVQSSEKVDLVIRLQRRHYGKEKENVGGHIKLPLRPRFDTAFPSPLSTPLETTYSPEYYPSTTIDVATVEGFIQPTMTISHQNPLQSFDTQRPLTIEKSAPPILSAPSDAKSFPLKNVPLPQSAGANGVVPPGVAIKPLQADICADPIAANEPPAMFQRKAHAVTRQGIVGMDNVPVGTNKFWQHLTIGDGTLGVWTQPYMVWVNKAAGDWGLSISHTDVNQMANGPDPKANPVQYYISPLGLKSLSLSANEFNPNTSSMTTEKLQPHSGVLTLYANKSAYPSSQYMTVPLVQGMGFVSGYYMSLQPVMTTVILVRNLTYVGYVGNTPQGSSKIQKWRVTLEDGKIWMVYATSFPGSKELTLSLSGNNKIQGSAGYYGLVQVAKLPPNRPDGQNFEYVLDSTAGAMPMGATFSSSVNSATGTYTFNFARSASNDASGCLMYALPHHVASFDTATTGRVIPGMQLRATTKGLMTAVVADSWTLVENNLPSGIGFLPGNQRSYGPTAMSVIRAACTTEIGDDVVSLSNLNSQYFAGKALARYAQIVLVAADVLQDRTLASQGLNKLIAAFTRFATNKQQQPLAYETTWKGVISSTLDSGADFGNAWYNDHMFHYGYFVMAAAILVHVDQTLNGRSNWLSANKDYVNTLVRDVANPSDQDPYFPVSRNFDYFHGHSWATGLFPRGDGKDLESTSEDCMFSYGMKLWGNVIGDANMEARGNLMLAIQRRSFNSYFYFGNNNTNQPSNFVRNKVTGILFENKVDHTTYFSNAPYCIQGIHMLPLIPTSPYIKDKQFSLDEWNYYFAGSASGINNGWEGILYANAAIFAPAASWKFFADPGFSKALLDDGASKTWYLVFAAGLGGAPAN